MTPLRRYLVYLAFLPWQGGFFFYAAVVVPIGTDVLGSAAAQGMITARVTNILNLCGVVGLGVAGWDLAAVRDPTRWRASARWWCWGVAAVCQAGLFFLHLLLDSFLDPGRTHIRIGPPFAVVHGAYLWVSTLQWLACLLLAWWTLKAWAAEDGPARPANREG